MADPTLFFCVGATKAGTSWLHRYISDHPQAWMRGLKELHYFDAVAFDDWDTWIASTQARHDGNLRELDGLNPAARAIKQRVAADAAEWLTVLRARRADDAAYLAYLTNGRTDQRLVGDMTPAYGLLPRDRLAQMAGLMPEVKFVYILRDPVDRIWSHARMIAKRRAATPHEVAYRSVHIVRRILKGKEPEVERRSDYIGPVTNLLAAVRKENLRLVFYEELFSQPIVDDLCDFLGLDHKPADFGTQVLRGPEAEMDEGQHEQLRTFLKPQYDFIQATFDRIPDRWAVGGERVA